MANIDNQAADSREERNCPNHKRHRPSPKVIRLTKNLIGDPVAKAKERLKREQEKNDK